MVFCLTETTLFYHLLRLTNAPVAHPTTKYGTGLIANWADNVILAANHIPRTPTPSRIGTSNTLSSSELVTNASASRTDSTRFAVYQPPGLELNNEDEILAFLDVTLQRALLSDLDKGTSFNGKCASAPRCLA